MCYNKCCPSRPVGTKGSLVQPEDEALLQVWIACHPVLQVKLKAYSWATARGGQDGSGCTWGSHLAKM